jgi:Tfp pilus assembly protein PilZ
MIPGRRTTRFVPRRLVSVALECAGLPRALGVVKNLSESGACVDTDNPFAVGRHMTAALSFPNEARPFQARGRIVWVKQSGPGSVSCGGEFLRARDLPRAPLETLIRHVRP